MAKGGKQPGAGRPKGSLAKSTFDALEARKKAIAMVDEKLREIFTPQIEKAIAGDTNAFNAVLNRAWGTPAQYVELTGKDGKSLFEPSEKIKALAHELLEKQRNL